MVGRRYARVARRQRRRRRGDRRADGLAAGRLGCAGRRRLRRGGGGTRGTVDHGAGDTRAPRRNRRAARHRRRSICGVVRPRRRSRFARPPRILPLVGNRRVRDRSGDRTHCGPSQRRRDGRRVAPRARSRPRRDRLRGGVRVGLRGTGQRRRRPRRTTICGRRPGTTASFRARVPARPPPCSARSASRAARRRWR